MFHSIHNTESPCFGSLACLSWDAVQPSPTVGPGAWKCGCACPSTRSGIGSLQVDEHHWAGTAYHSLLPRTYSLSTA